MKKILLLLLVLAAALFLAKMYLAKTDDIKVPAILERPKIKEKPLDKYTIELLSRATFEASPITVAEKLKEGDGFSSYLFYFYLNNLKVSGLLNVPEGEGIYPVIVMFRGYVDREKYETGVGTSRAGEVIAGNGFITLAPDFLGYGTSDNPSTSPIEERFQTYTTALTLLASLKNLNSALASSQISTKANLPKVGLWGHSNGGQIALTILEISQKSFPTVLWAPVSKPFPYSILYFTDDFDDRGRMLRKVIAEFEEDYDAEKYSLTNYFERIAAPLEIHQGGADESVPLWWSNQFVERLTKLEKDVTYFTYPGDDHNFGGGSWQTVVARNIAFFKNRLE